MRFLVLFLFLSLLDAGTKFLVVVYAPEGEFLRLIYNPNAIMGLEVMIPHWKLWSLLFLPLIWVFAREIQNEKTRHLALALFYAGAINNSIERVLSPMGVIDFLNFSGYLGMKAFYCNFADIYQWVGYAVFIYGFYSQSKKEVSLEVEPTK